jgi:hypothetical protein
VRLFSKLDVLGFAKWPSLLLITLVPIWFYLNGWDGGFGTTRMLVADVTVDKQPYRLWRSGTQDGTETWCAQPLGSARPHRKLSFVEDGLEVVASFDAGLFCAELPETATDVKLEPR